MDANKKKTIFEKYKNSIASRPIFVVKKPNIKTADTNPKNQINEDNKIINKNEQANSISISIDIDSNYMNENLNETAKVIETDKNQEKSSVNPIIINNNRKNKKTSNNI